MVWTRDDPYCTKLEPCLAVFALLLILYLYLSTIFIILLPWTATALDSASPFPSFSITSQTIYLIITIQTCLLCMVLWSFGMASLSDPGYVVRTQSLPIQPSDKEPPLVSASTAVPVSSGAGSTLPTRPTLPLPLESPPSPINPSSVPQSPALSSSILSSPILSSPTLKSPLSPSSIPPSPLLPSHTLADIPNSTPIPTLAPTHRPIIVPDHSSIQEGWTCGVTFCKKCDAPRPLRAHHCSACHRCIRKMDHHCPWIANCVGWSNHGHFIRFLIYVWLAATITLASLTYRVVERIYVNETILSSHPSVALEAAILVVNSLLLFFIVIAVGLLAASQLYTASINMTTIERLEYNNALEIRARPIHRHSPLPVLAYPYRVGTLVNLKLVFGARIWAWPFPLPSAYQLQGLGNGIQFPTIDPHIHWPPPNLSEDIYTFSSSNDDSTEDEHDLIASKHEARSFSINTNRQRRFRRGSEGYIVPTTNRYMPS